MLQNFRGEASRIHYYIFDLLFRKNRDLTRPPLVERRLLLKSRHADALKNCLVARFLTQVAEP